MYNIVRAPLQLQYTFTSCFIFVLSNRIEILNHVWHYDALQPPIIMCVNLDCTVGQVTHQAKLF